MRGRRKSCERGCKKRGGIAVSMKIAIKDRKKCNISAVRKRLKTVSERRGVDETKSF
ncbi:hypothetical protein E2C01_014016 [Portunus trituberculatus]|uniref:Uncharacterized protein n=1 Tax=Portunus trituberculatus TaxID=210409 RepID=A0A5B7DIW1_PORTR|nr:hypothetical protein [Portunus trituberculatus]